MTLAASPPSPTSLRVLFFSFSSSKAPLMSDFYSVLFFVVLEEITVPDGKSKGRNHNGPHFGEVLRLEGVVGSRHGQHTVSTQL